MEVAVELASLRAALPRDPGFGDLWAVRSSLGLLAERCRSLGARGRTEVASVEGALAEVEASLDAHVARTTRAIAQGTLRGERLFDALAALTSHPLDLGTPHVGDDPADFLIERVFGTCGRFDGGASPGPEMIHYEPSPVSATLALARLGWFAPGTTFVDVGSGTGRVPIVASLLSGVRTVGVEIDERLARVATNVAARLGADVDVRLGDARTAPIEDGDAFFFFAPFIGGVLDSVLDRLARVANEKRLRIGSWGPSSELIAACGAFEAEQPSFGPFDLVTFRTR